MSEEKTEPIPLPTEVAIAQRAMEQRAMVISQHRYQPKLIWTLRPWSAAELRAAVEFEGSPFVVANQPVPLPRQAVLWAGAPVWAQYAYLIMVEVKAINVGG